MSCSVLDVWSAVGGQEYRWDFWAQGVNGAMFQMLAHGISSAGMFFMVGVLYDRVHHRNLNEFGGIFSKMPVYSGLAIAVFFAGLGLPGLCGFIGEVLVTLSSWNLQQNTCRYFSIYGNSYSGVYLMGYTESLSRSRVPWSS